MAFGGGVCVHLLRQKAEGRAAVQIYGLRVPLADTN